jgi:hypothetical protein
VNLDADAPAFELSGPLDEVCWRRTIKGAADGSQEAQIVDNDIGALFHKLAGLLVFLVNGHVVREALFQPAFRGCTPVGACLTPDENGVCHGCRLRAIGPGAADRGERRA